MSFLDLPAEIRNDIYTLVLREDEPIEVDADHMLPGLVQVNQQIRQESLSLYFGLSAFRIIVHDSDGTLYIGWRKLCARNYPDEAWRFDYELTGEPDTGNLIKWLYGRWKNQFVLVKELPELWGVLSELEEGRHEFHWSAHMLLNRFLDKSFEEYGEVFRLCWSVAMAYDRDGWK